MKFINASSWLPSDPQPPQMGSMGLMNPPSMMYNQPGMKPPNPFGSVSSAQVSFSKVKVNFIVHKVHLS